MTISGMTKSGITLSQMPLSGMTLSGIPLSGMTVIVKTLTQMIEAVLDSSE
jgi:hypothetical protein